MTCATASPWHNQTVLHSLTCTQRHLWEGTCFVGRNLSRCRFLIDPWRVSLQLTRAAVKDCFAWIWRNSYLCYVFGPIAHMFHVFWFGETWPFWQRLIFASYKQLHQNTCQLHPWNACGRTVESFSTDWVFWHLKKGTHWTGAVSSCRLAEYETWKTDGG